MLAALSQSSTDTMVALQKKQSLLFIRCWLMQALQRGGEECYRVSSHASPPICLHGAHLLAGFVTTRLEHSRDGVGIADWAEVLLIGGQGGSCCLGRCRGQVSQHPFHLGQLLSTDVIRIAL